MKITRRVSKQDRARLAGASMRDLAQNVIGIGNSMDATVHRLAAARLTNPDSVGASKSYEATQLSHDRAQLAAICVELLARVNKLQLEA